MSLFFISRYQTGQISEVSEVKDVVSGTVTGCRFCDIMS